MPSSSKTNALFSNNFRKFGENYLPGYSDTRNINNCTSNKTFYFNNIGPVINEIKTLKVILSKAEMALIILA